MITSSILIDKLTAITWIIALVSDQTDKKTHVVRPECLILKLK